MIDIRYNYRNDCKKKQDPDKYSLRLKQDHCVLWSKRLPNTKYGRLSLRVVNNEIVGIVDGRKLIFSPDSITNCYSYRKSTEGLRQIEGIKELLIKYKEIDYTIGSSLIFPVLDDNNSSSWTINKARGCSRKIQDRIDYTLECVRRFYLDHTDNNPLATCLNRYSFFFELFDNFENYVKYFCLDDLVTPDYRHVLSFTDTFDFENPLPNESNYALYIERTIDFIRKRNQRIKKCQSRVQRYSHEDVENLEKEYFDKFGKQLIAPMLFSNTVIVDLIEEAIIRNKPLTDKDTSKRFHYKEGCTH